MQRINWAFLISHHKAYQTNSQLHGSISSEHTWWALTHQNNSNSRQITHILYEIWFVKYKDLVMRNSESLHRVNFKTWLASLFKMATFFITYVWMKLQSSILSNSKVWKRLNKCNVFPTNFISRHTRNFNIRRITAEIHSNSFITIHFQPPRRVSLKRWHPQAVDTCGQMYKPYKLMILEC